MQVPIDLPGTTNKQDPANYTCASFSFPSFFFSSFFFLFILGRLSQLPLYVPSELLKPSFNLHANQRIPCQHRCRLSPDLWSTTTTISEVGAPPFFSNIWNNASQKDRRFGVVKMFTDFQHVLLASLLKWRGTHLNDWHYYYYNYNDEATCPKCHICLAVHMISWIFL